jgi:hypothetical protein
MHYIIAACVDQAEAINSQLGQSSYNLNDLLPGGQSDYKLDLTLKCLAVGTQDQIALIPGTLSSKLFKILQDTVWKTRQGQFGGAFGPVVSFLSLYLPLSQSHIFQSSSSIQSCFNMNHQ